MGPHPERSTEIAHTANQNFLTTAAKILAEDITSGTREGVKGSAKWAVQGVVAGAAIGAYAVIPTVWSFFLSNTGLLREFAAVAGFEISWLHAFLNWLDPQRIKRQI